MDIILGLLNSTEECLMDVIMKRIVSVKSIWKLPAPFVTGTFIIKDNKVHFTISFTYNLDSIFARATFLCSHGRNARLIRL